jgi:hypothetical protein
MEINKALEELINSDSFKEKAKEKNNEGSKLRMFLTRYQRNEVKTSTVVSLLEEFGYQIEVFPASNNKKS